MLENPFESIQAPGRQQNTPRLRNTLPFPQNPVTKVDYFISEKNDKTPRANPPGFTGSQAPSK